MPQPNNTIDAGALGGAIPAPGTPATVAEVEIGGTKYVVAPQLAEALKAAETARTREFNELKVTVDRLQKAAPAAPAPAKTNIADRLFTDPEAVLNEHAAEVEKRVTDRLTGEYTKAEQRKLFWSKFDAEHDDLKGDRDLVEFVMGKHYDELAALPVEKQNDRLADLTRKMLGKAAKAPRNENPVTIEGGGFTRGEAPPAPKTDEQPEGGNVASISKLLRDRRNQRHEARKAARST